MFGTDLFNGEVVGDTIANFRDATIALSLGTYVIAFLVLWGVYKMDAVERFLKRGRDLLVGQALGLKRRAADLLYRARKKEKEDEGV